MPANQRGFGGTLRWVDIVDRLATDVDANETNRGRSWFGWNYWATSKFVEDSDKDSRSSLASMHFQLLRYAHYLLTWEDEHSKDMLERLLTDWIAELEDRNTRGFYAFATRELSVRDPKYRLEDHVWMWELLLSAEDLGLGQMITTKRKSRKEEKSSLTKDYSSVEFRRQVLQRSPQKIQLLGSG